jgi:hypothetical protein
MREGVHKIVYIRERLEFPAAHLFHTSFSVRKNLSTSLLDEVLPKQFLQFLLLRGRELLYVFNYFRKGLTHVSNSPQRTLVLRILPLFAPFNPGCAPLRQIILPQHSRSNGTIRTPALGDLRQLGE